MGNAERKGLQEVRSEAAERAREIARAVFMTRKGRGSAGIASSLSAAVALIVCLWAFVQVAAPATVAFLAFVKEDASEALGRMALYADGWLFHGWAFVGLLGESVPSELSRSVLLVYCCLWAVLCAYAAACRGRRMRKTLFGTPESEKSSEKGDARVETNQLVLASTTRTWNPSERIVHAGLVIGYSALFHRYYLSGEQCHTQTIAPPGVGKTTRVVYPTIHAILSSEDSAIVYDPKGELYDNTSEEALKSGRKVICIDYGNWKRSNLYNTLSEVSGMYEIHSAAAESAVAEAARAQNKGEYARARRLALEARNHRIEALSKSDSLAADVAEAIVPDKPGTEQFWRPSARSLLRALVLLVATYREREWSSDRPAPSTPAPEQRTLKSVRNLLARYGKPSKRQIGPTVSDYIPLEDIFAGLDQEHPAAKAFAQSKNSPNMTLGGIISTLLQVIDEVVDEESNMMSYGTDFSFEDIGRQKTIVYLIVPEESPAKFAYLPIFTAQAYQAFARLARKCGGEMPRWVHFIQEELGNTPMIPRYANMIGTGRGYGMRFHPILQNPYQWDAVYGHDSAKSIRSSINVTNWLKVNDYESAKELSEVIGARTVAVSQSGSSAPASPLLGALSGSVSSSTRLDGSNLVPPAKLLSWDPLWGAFVRRSSIDRNGILNRILFRRHEAHVALYPTEKPQNLPTFAAFGLKDRVAAREKALRAQSIDRSGERAVVPPWDAIGLTDPEKQEVRAFFEPGALDERTRADLEEAVWGARAAPDARAAAARYVGLMPDGADPREFARECVADAKTQVKQAIAVSNRLVAAMEEGLGLGRPYSCEMPGFVKSRARAKALWLEAFEERLHDLVREPSDPGSEEGAGAMETEENDDGYDD